MTISHVKLLSMPVRDQDRAKSFYTEALGFELLADEDMAPDQRWVQVAPKGADTSITLVTWFDSMPAGAQRGLVLETDDLDADVAALAAKGVPVSGVEDAPWGRYVTFADPDGNGFVLQASTARP